MRLSCENIVTAAALIFILGCESHINYAGKPVCSDISTTKIGERVLLCGPVGIGKQGYYVNVGGEAVYLFGKKNGSDLGKDFTTKRRHAKVVFYISGQSHYEKRSDFRSGAWLTNEKLLLDEC